MKKNIVFIITGIMFYSILVTNSAFPATLENWIDFAEPPEILSLGVYEIYTAEQLAWIAKRTNEGHDFHEEEVLLCADIDLSGKEWTPIGAIYFHMLPDDWYSPPLDPMPPIYFSGIFNGNGYKISNISITDPELTTLGLFGILRDARITNIDIVDCEIFGYISEDDEDIIGSFAGALAAGIFASEISQCRSTGNVSGYTAGGLAGGAIDETYISQSAFIGNVSGERYIGGLVGGTDATISQCYTAGTVSSEHWAGGLVGSQSSSGIVKNCYSEMDIIDDWRSAGLIGFSWYGYVESCYWSGFNSYLPLIGPYENDANGDYTRLAYLYWDSEKSGISGVGYKGTPLTTAQLKAELPPGFDPDIWAIIPGSTYPYLKAFGDNIFTLEVSQTGDNILEVKISGDASDCVLVSALCDVDGRLLETKNQPASSIIIEFSQPIAENRYKIFLWSDMARMIPISLPASNK